MTDINHLLWEIQGRLTTVEHRLLRMEEGKAQPAQSSWITELLLSPLFLKLTGAAILFGAGYKLEAGAIISRLMQ